MHARIGDELILFDGNGAEFTARTGAAGTAELWLIQLERLPSSRHESGSTG